MPCHVFKDFYTSPQKDHGTLEHLLNDTSSECKKTIACQDTYSKVLYASTQRDHGIILCLLKDMLQASTKKEKKDSDMQLHLEINVLCKHTKGPW